MWLYLSRSGALLRSLPTGQREIIAFCYAGRQHGLNDPDFQYEKGIGPIPEGYYTIEPPHDSPTTGPYTLGLAPDPGNDMRGRASFAVHGERKTNPAESSHGCIIAPKSKREFVWTSGDRLLRVVAD